MNHIDESYYESSEMSLENYPIDFYSGKKLKFLEIFGRKIEITVKGSQLHLLEL